MPCYNEWHIQREFFKWLDLYPKLRAVSFSIPNERGSRNVKEMGWLKMTGLTSGAPDVGIFYPSGSYHGMFIEFKSPKGKVSVAQSAMLKNLTTSGYKCVICRSTADAAEQVTLYCKNKLQNEL